MKRVLAPLFVTVLVACCYGQGMQPGTATQAVTPETQPARPLPDVATLMLAVEAHQRADETTLKDYIYRQTQTVDETDGHGGVKKREVEAYDVFWLQGVPVRKKVSKDGKPMTADELKKEDERIDKEVKAALAKRAKNDGKGKQTDPRGDEEETVSRILELGTFSNARRVQIAGRPAIAADYAGDPKAKTRNKAEEVIRDLVGTVWVDEEDKELVRTEGRFNRSFKIGGGLVANIKEGTSFSGEFRKINGEVWLPVRFDGHGAARFLLFFNLNGSLQIVDEDFRKFKATSTLLPGVSAAEEEKP